MKYTDQVWKGGLASFKKPQEQDKLLQNSHPERRKFASFDITNMYTNIPNKKVREIIHDILIKNDVDQRIKKVILDICDVIMQQNYYFFSEKYYIHKYGLAMGAPTSSIVSELYIQHVEHTLFSPILRKCRILGYFRYVNDVLTIYKH